MCHEVGVACYRMNDTPVFLAVSELTNLIKNRLETDFPSVAVTGEISNFKPASSGHWYFTLKDNNAAVQCVLFRGRQRHIPDMPRDGDQIDAVGSISVYPPRGSYQLIVEILRRSGRGSILQMLDERKERLGREGLFERRRGLSLLPRSVVVITSPTGAAIRDILQVLSRRRLRLIIRIIPVPVQGADSAEKIAAAIRYASAHRLGDVVIVGRGGGSIEDLLAFSDEEVVRAVAASEIPVVSAVGHETDWALCDYAADVRAPTPSAAAELVSGRDADFAETVRLARQDIHRTYRGLLDALRRRLDQVNRTELRYRFRNLVQPWYQRLDEARRGALEGYQRMLQIKRHHLTVITERIGAADPYGPLSRGFALVRRAADGQIITARAKSEVGARLTVQFSDGTINVERTEDE